MLAFWRLALNSYVYFYYPILFYATAFPRLCIQQQKFFRPNGLSVLVS